MLSSLLNRKVKDPALLLTALGAAGFPLANSILRRLQQSEHGTTAGLSTNAVGSGGVQSGMVVPQTNVGVQPASSGNIVSRAVIPKEDEEEQLRKILFALLGLSSFFNRG